MIGRSRRSSLTPRGIALRELSLRARVVLTAALVALPALVLYALTLMPDVGFWDTAEFQAIGPVLGIAHPTGYPSYTLLAWLASVVLQPFGTEAVRANLLSAILVAGSCAIVGVMVTYLTSRVVAGVAAGIGLALCLGSWSIALHADPHALHIFLAAAVLALLIVWGERVRRGDPADRWLVAAAAVFGVSLGNHGLTLLLAPGIGLYVLAVRPSILRRSGLIAACVAALVLTTVALYAYLPIRSAMNPPLDYANPQTWEGFTYLVFAEQFRGTFRALPGVAETVALVVGENWDQLGLLFPLAGVGLIFGVRRRPALMLLLVTWFGVNWWFALGYINADIGRYYLVPLLCVALLGGLGAGALYDLALSFRAQVEARRHSILRIIVPVVAAVVLIGPPLAAVPTRRAQVDQSDYLAGRAWLDEVGAALPANAVVVSWWSFSTTLWYGQYVEGWRPDVTVIDDRTMIDQHLGSAEEVLDRYLGVRPLYLIRLSIDIPQFHERYVLAALPGVDSGPVYEVRSHQPTAKANL